MDKKPVQPCYVLGVGMTKFIKPRGKVDYTELGFEAGVKAMLDAHINYDDVDQGIACYCYGDSTCGQRVFYQFGMTKIPIINVNNNCSTGSTGLAMARQTISHGGADCILVIGFEKMMPGSLQSLWRDRSNPIGTTFEMVQATRGVTNAPGAAQIFGNAGREYMEKLDYILFRTTNSPDTALADMAPKQKTSRRSHVSTTNTPNKTPIPSSKTYIPSNK
jgi:sterol carrier protein 2